MDAKSGSQLDGPSPGVDVASLLLVSLSLMTAEGVVGKAAGRGDLSGETSPLNQTGTPFGPVLQCVLNLPQPELIVSGGRIGHLFVIVRWLDYSAKPLSDWNYA